ncbi:MAG: hypothetical protein JO314_05845, partial [Acidobacteria bacterium]|nr:hypothetical protein [Acidobacteriota bacterium]
EAGAIEATPEQLVELRDKREAFVQAVHHPKIALRNAVAARARTQTNLARLLKIFDAECNPDNETGH